MKPDTLTFPEPTLAPGHASSIAEELWKQPALLHDGLNEFCLHGILVTDTDLRIRHWNRWLEERSGVSADGVCGRSLLEIFPEIEARGLQSLYRRALNGETAVLSHRLHRYLLPLHARTGQNAAAWMLQSARIAPLRRDGQIIGTVTVVEDVTERVTRESELQRLVNFLEASLNEVYVFDPASLRFSYVNRSALQNLGYTAEQIRALTPLDLKPEFTEESFRQAIAPLLAGSAAKHQFQTIHRRADGTDYPAEVCLQLVASGTERVFLAVINDITERRKQEKKVAELNRRLVEISRQAGMAEVATCVLHNVGNVLNSVNVSLETVSKRTQQLKVGNLGKVADLLLYNAAAPAAFFANPQGAKLPAFLGQLAEHFTREQTAILAELNSLRINVEHINEIVAMQQSFASCGGVIETIRVSELIEDALRMNADSMARHAVTVVREFAEVPSVSVDKHKLMQVLVNLIRNGKQSCDQADPPEKRLTVQIANGDGCVEISIADNGVGIPPENLDRIFNHGFTTKKAGHGFGLHSAANAAGEMGGRLRVESAGTGMGASFTIELPVQPPNL